MAQQSIEDRVAYLERKVAEYEAERAQVRELHELRDDLRLRIQAMGAEIRDEIDSQVDALRTEYQAGYGYLVERLNGIGERLSGVEQSLGEQKQAIGQLQSGQRELQAGLTG